MKTYFLDDNDRHNIEKKLNIARSKLIEYNEKINVIEKDIPMLEEKILVFQDLYKYINRHKDRSRIINECNNPPAFAFTDDTLYYKSILLADDKADKVNEKYNKYKNDLEYAQKKLQIYKSGKEFLKKDIELLENIQRVDISYSHYEEAGLKQY